MPGRTGSGEASLRASELLGAISLATDLGTGQPNGHALRTCAAAVALARELGLDDDGVGDVHSVALLRFLGCTADSTETGRLTGGDNLGFMAAMAPVLMGGSRETLGRFVRTVGADQPTARRARLVARALGDPGGAARSLSMHCEVATLLATRLGMGAGVVEALAHAYERWDGKGYPEGLAGDAIPLAVRIVAVARDVELLRRVAPDDWLEVVRARRGRAYDPAVVDAVLADGKSRTSAADEAGAWVAAMEAEPGPVRVLGPDQLDHAVEVIGDFTDLASPWTRGHSRRVAELAEGAARACGLPEEDVGTLRRAGHVHDVGHVGVPIGIWDRPGSLGVDEWERVRLHPYLSERVLTHCSPFEPVARLAGSHHERLDGSGYHREVAGPEVPLTARILAASDVFAAVGEDRPHRAAFESAHAIDELRGEAAVGRLDGDAVEAVLSAAGHARSPTRRAWPGGLTDREVEVLRLVARGRTNREIAGELHVSAKTVGRHVENLYTKIGVSSRAAAAVFAMQEHLLTTE